MDRLGGHTGPSLSSWRSSWLSRMPFWAILTILESILDCFGALLGASWPVFGPSWRPSGPSETVGSPRRGERGNHRKAFGQPVIFASWAVLGVLFGHLLGPLGGPFGRLLGNIGGIFGRTWRPLGPPWSVLEAILDRLGLSWRPMLGHLGRLGGGRCADLAGFLAFPFPQCDRNLSCVAHFPGQKGAISSLLCERQKHFVKASSLDRRPQVTCPPRPRDASAGDLGHEDLGQSSSAGAPCLGGPPRRAPSDISGPSPRNVPPCRPPCRHRASALPHGQPLYTFLPANAVRREARSTAGLCRQPWILK